MQLSERANPIAQTLTICTGRSSLLQSEQRPGLLRLLRAFLATTLICSPALLSAQQPASGQTPPDAPSATRQEAAKRKPPSGFAALNEKSLFFPNIVTTEGPLSAGDKFKLFAANSASIGTILGSALSAGIAQAEDSPRGYGQGAEGYGKRFGASMARTASNQFFSTFMLASMLRQDPRFY